MPYSPWMKPFLLADLFLMNKVFMPLAWWIDWRWHRSPYQVAMLFITAAQLVNASGTLLMLVYRGHWPALLMVGIALFLHFSIFSFHRKQLRQCQAQYERRADMLCIAQMIYMHGSSYFMRICYVTFGTMMALSMLAADLATSDVPAGALANSWILFLGIACYFAGTFPPQRPRRQKKERAWGLLHASPTPA